MSATHESIYTAVMRLRSMGVPKNKIQIILTKETISNLVEAEVEFMDIQPGMCVPSYDIQFAGQRVYLGMQDRVQVVEQEVFL